MSGAEGYSDSRPGVEPSKRAADADRDAVADRLREAAGEGRLTLEELEERLEVAFTAKTYGELDRVVADLPEVAGTPGTPRARAPQDDEPLVLSSRHGRLRQVGYWYVPPRIKIAVDMAEVKIDFTRADCPHREVVVEVSAAMGQVLVVVPRGWDVRADSLSVGMGNLSNRARERPEPGAPVLRFQGRMEIGQFQIRYANRFEARRARKTST